jgi:hypothetical protein
VLSLSTTRTCDHVHHALRQAPCTQADISKRLGAVLLLLLLLGGSIPQAGMR